MLCQDGHFFMPYFNADMQKGLLMKKITVKQITITAALLAICILSQYFKNLSVYITGPIVNACILLATLAAGLGSGVILSIIAPITAFFFTGSDLMAAMPLLFPAIMLGNITICFFAWFLNKKFKFKFRLETGLVLGSIAKAAVMGILIVLIIFPTFGDALTVRIGDAAKATKMLNGARVVFSLTQLTTSLIGSALTIILWYPLRKVMQNEQ